MTEGEVIELAPEKPLEYNTGAVAVKKCSGVTKVRKGQTEEAFLEQKEMFWESGPVISTDSCLVDKLSLYIEDGLQEAPDDASNTPRDVSEILQDLTLSKQDISVMSTLEKIDRELLFKGMEKLYFNRDYERCLTFASSILRDMTKIDLTSKEGKAFKRNVLDVTQIRDLCLDKLKTRTTTTTPHAETL